MTVTLCSLITRFFRNYLKAECGASDNTIASYGDCVRLLLNFCCERLHLAVDRLRFEHIDQALVLDFLDHLEQHRGNGPSTRNQRLAAIKTFFRFLALQEPDLAHACEQIRAIHTKKTEHPVIDTLTHEQISAIVDAPSSDTVAGRRDRAILALMYNTGARVQELADLAVEDLQTDALPQVTLTGKGRKRRIVPLWPDTVAELNAYLGERSPEDAYQDHPLFRNAGGQRITRFGIAQRLRVHTAAASRSCPSLSGRRVTPHVIRHTTALHLIQVHNDITVVKDWMGHADLRTTNQYFQIDLEMKREALRKCPPPILPHTSHKPMWRPPAILAFLKQLARPRPPGVMSSPRKPAQHKCGPCPALLAT